VFVTRQVYAICKAGARPTAQEVKGHIDALLDGSCDVVAKKEVEGNDDDSLS